MDIILESETIHDKLVHIDDIINTSEMPEDRPNRIAEALRLLTKAGVTIKLKMCHFYSKLFDYLGKVKAPGKLQLAFQTAKAVDALE